MNIIYNRYIASSDGQYVCQKIEQTPPKIIAPETQRIVDIPERPREIPVQLPSELQRNGAEEGARKKNIFQRLLPESIELDDIIIILILILLVLDSDEDEDILNILLTVAAFMIL